MQVFVCVCVRPCMCERAEVSSPLRWGVWMAPVCTASHLSPLQDKGSSVSGPLLRLLEMIWSVLLSTEKIISSQRGGPLVSAGPLEARRTNCRALLLAWVTSGSDGQTRRQTRGSATHGKSNTHRHTREARGAKRIIQQRKYERLSSHCRTEIL